MARLGATFTTLALLRLTSPQQFASREPHFRQLLLNLSFETLPQLPHLPQHLCIPHRSETDLMANNDADKIKAKAAAKYDEPQILLGLTHISQNKTQCRQLTASEIAVGVTYDDLRVCAWRLHQRPDVRVLRQPQHFRVRVHDAMGVHLDRGCHQCAALIRTYRQIYREAALLPFKLNTFDTYHCDAFYHMPNAMSPSQRLSITSIEVEFDKIMQHDFFPPWGVSKHL